MGEHCRIPYRELLDLMKRDFSRGRENGSWPIMVQAYREHYGVSSVEEFLEKFPDESIYERYCEDRYRRNDPA